MPGGSVNGKPFRESSDAYSRTGIPCGNPKRYRSHEVVRMEPGQRSRSRPIDGPVEEIETEGQKQLQTLLKKQLDTNVSLKQHFQNKKEFSSVASHKPGVEDLSGVTTLSDYQTREKTDSYIEEMKAYGLTEEEILLKLQHEEPQLSNIKRSRLTNPDHDQSRLQEIERKIQNKQQQLAKPDSFSNVKAISRHEMQLEKSISQSSQSSKFLHGMLIKEQSQHATLNSTDPMNNLQDIVKTITHKPFRWKHRKREKDNSYKLECNLECCVKTNTVGATHSDKPCVECERLGTECPLEHRKLPVATCMEKPADYVSCDKTDSRIEKSTSQPKPPDKDKVVPLNDEDIQSVPEDVIRRYRLSSEEIKKIPRFENYEPGEPNNVLFLKNLSSKVTREDLVALFNRYHKTTGETTEYKLMTGRMKGQAFVTFQNTETARRALELVHGYDFKGKPIIIVYGKKTSKS